MFADAFTQAYGESGSCGQNFVGVFLAYRDVHGNEKNSAASAQNFVDWFADDASTEFIAEHTICFFDCESNCDVSFTTRPK